MCELDTQDILADIRDATQHGEEDALFFLLVSTPGGAPNSFHSKVIQPYLKGRGWRKVNYKTTGFRALYFLHIKSESEVELGDNETCPRCNFNKTLNNVISPKKKITPKKRKASEDHNINVTTPPPVPLHCEQCYSASPTQTAGKDRTQLKETVDRYKQINSKVFQVHIVLSRPVDYEEDFLEFASQPGSVEE
uniref:Uncharacterized protein n=1 Tax=Ciona savignyi TaxID=51511 RepID=H2ZDS5_CIOSA